MSWFGARNLQEMFELKFKEAGTLTESIHISEQLFRTGRANYLEVLFTQQNALQARLELVETKKNQLLATVNMYKALGVAGDNLLTLTRKPCQKREQQCPEALKLADNPNTFLSKRRSARQSNSGDCY